MKAPEMVEGCWPSYKCSSLVC